MKRKHNLGQFNKLSKSSDVWESDIEEIQIVENCGFVKKSNKTIVVCPEVVDVIGNLCTELKIEWQMLLSGRVVDDEVIIDGYYIPKQSVSGASVKNLEPINKKLIEEKGIVAGIHSHGRMDVFFSPTDNEMNMGDIEYNIVVNNAMEVKAVQKIVLPCGSCTLVKVNCVFETRNVDVIGFGNIQEPKHIGFGRHGGISQCDGYAKPQNNYGIYDEYDYGYSTHGLAVDNKQSDFFEKQNIHGQETTRIIRDRSEILPDK